VPVPVAGGGAVVRHLRSHFKLLASGRPLLAVGCRSVALPRASAMRGTDVRGLPLEQPLSTLSRRIATSKLCAWVLFHTNCGKNVGLLYSHLSEIRLVIADTRFRSDRPAVSGHVGRLRCQVFLHCFSNRSLGVRCAGSLELILK
jgi:hypothetical protein